MHGKRCQDQRFRTPEPAAAFQAGTHNGNNFPNAGRVKKIHAGGLLPENEANKEKYSRLKARHYLTKDNKVNIMVAKWSREEFLAKIPRAGEEIKRKFADYVLELAMKEARKYPPQMQDLIVERVGAGFIGNTVALMVMDNLYENGTFRPLTEQEKVTSQLIMFSDILPAC